ncbi:hypothetical protein BASA81_002959 [Batrachochytrium salamandrivorans]|nr:hypothetical protein BASA81_002959 [Batrachochytrium salamandrivorans]
MSWQDVVAERLRERDRVEKLLFEPIVTAYASLWASSLQKQRALARAAVGELERKIDELQNEVTALRRSEELANELRIQLDRTKAKLAETQSQLEDQTRAATRHRDEVVLLRDELTRTANLLEHSENKNRQLAKENFDLIDRVLTEKLTLADQLNEMTRLNASLTDKLEKLQVGGEAGPSSPATSPSQTTASPTTGGGGGGLGTALLEREPVPSSTSKHCIRIPAHQSEIPTIRYDEQGGTVFTCSCDGTIKAWDAFRGTLMKTLRTPVDTQLMGMDCKKKIVAGTGSDRAVRLWNLDTDRVFHTLIGHASKLYACRLTADAKALVTGGTDRKIMTWDVATGNRVRQISCSSICNAVDVYEHYVVSGHQDSCVRLWDMRTGTMTTCMNEVHSSTITSVEFVSFRAILTNSRDNTVGVIDLAAGRVDQRFGHMSYKSAYNWSSAAISSSHKMVGAGGADGKVYLWDALEILGSGSSSTAAGLEGRTREITQCRSGTPLMHSDKRIAAFAFNPTHRGHCASADEDGLLCLWSPEAK